MTSSKLNHLLMIHISTEELDEIDITLLINIVPRHKDVHLLHIDGICMNSMCAVSLANHLKGTGIGEEEF